MTVYDRLDELSELVETARSMPMSASCVLNRAELLALIDEVRQLVPQEIDAAEVVLADRDAIVRRAEGDREAILHSAHVEQAQLVSEHEVYQRAVAEGEAVRNQAHQDALQMRKEIDGYVDSKLANFEISLTRTLEAVQEGRERINARFYEGLNESAPAEESALLAPDEQAE